MIPAETILAVEREAQDRSTSRQKDSAAHDSLRKAVLAYLSECDNPVPDYNYRRTLRNHLRTLTGAPAEPRPRDAQ